MFAAVAKRTAGRAAARPTTVNASRSIYVNVHGEQDAERVASRIHGILNEDGIVKSLNLKKFHEKGSQRRKRKVEEQTIRHANRTIGSMIHYILKRKKFGF